MADEEKFININCSDDCDSDEECNWTKEGEFIVKEFESVVNYIGISTKLEQSERLIYFNCETKEGDKYCIELTSAGFRIVSNSFDTIDQDKQYGMIQKDEDKEDDEDDESGQRIPIFYETMNALLDKMSPLYRIAFSDQLIIKLNAHANK